MKTQKKPSDLSKREETLIEQKYIVQGKVGEGTYGVVSKATLKSSPGSEKAIKQFKSSASKEGEGISLTAYREIMLLRELDHENIVRVTDVILDPMDRSLYLVCDYAEYDLFEIIKYHRDKGKRISEFSIKSYLWQMLNGIHYLHSNWILHRDLKPSNILVMGVGPEIGRIKIADFGLARIFKEPLRPLSENGVVVTIWYRAPELLLSANHYSRAIDVWALGCIFAELYLTKPLFPSNPPQPTHQLKSIYDILGAPTPQRWPGIVDMPDYSSTLSQLPSSTDNKLRSAMKDIPPLAFDLLEKMLEYDPDKRITAEEALDHKYFNDSVAPSLNAFEKIGPIGYPKRLQR